MNSFAAWKEERDDDRPLALALSLPRLTGFSYPLAFVQTRRFTAWDTRGGGAASSCAQPGPLTPGLSRAAGSWVKGCRSKPSDLRTGCWPGDRGVLLQENLLGEVTPTPLSLPSGRRYEGEGKSREALCRSLRGPGNLP